MITNFQLIAIVFSLIMIYFAYLHYLRREIGKVEIISWWIIWTTTIVIIIFPRLLSDIARDFFITRVFDMMVIGGFILVIYLSYKAYIKVRALEKKIDDLIRQDALNALRNEK